MWKPPVASPAAMATDRVSPMEQLLQAKYSRSFDAFARNASDEVINRSNIKANCK
jgi:hypothetical protein